MILKPNYPVESAYFGGYVNTAKGDDMLASLKLSADELIEAVANLPEEKGSFRYDDSKWTIKQLIQHITDTDRIFVYRALVIARKDLTSLPAYDENLYAANDCTETLTLTQVINEFKVVRQATITFFENISKDAIDLEGNANKNKFTPRIIGWLLSGHTTHHFNVLKERYLN